MGRNVNLTDSQAYGFFVRHGLKLALMSKAATADMAIGATWPPVLLLDPSGATKAIQLPPEEEGLAFIIKNTADADEDLTVEEDSATTTIGTVGQGTAALFVCDGTTWHMVLGGTLPT